MLCIELQPLLGVDSTDACLSLKRKETMETLICPSQRISTLLCSISRSILLEISIVNGAVGWYQFT